jgi:hypothetical protein
MSLKKILDLTENHNFKKSEVTEERMQEDIQNIRDLIAFYREYPDLFVDDIKGPDCTFKFRFTQRVFLRIIMRHKYVYCVFTRGFSKSFLAIMGLMIRAILFPGSQLFVTTGGKEQAALITIAKVEEICKLIPALQNEINWDRGVSKKSKDSVKYIFKNGSYIDILAARESSRGQRRNGGVIEEVILVEEQPLNEIIIPTTNVDRNLPDGTTDPDEVINQSQIYITSAGWKNSFAYNKLIEILLNSIIFPDKYMTLGGDYQLAILEGAVKTDMIEEMKLNGTYNEALLICDCRSRIRQLGVIDFIICCALDLLMEYKIEVNQSDYQTNCSDKTSVGQEIEEGISQSCSNNDVGGITTHSCRSTKICTEDLSNDKGNRIKLQKL